MGLLRKSWMVLLVSAAACGGGTASSDLSSTSSDLSARGGEGLFDHATFGGNGRTCATCHAEKNGGTLNPAEVQALYASNPNDPLFNPIDSDDGQGTSYSRLLNDATIRITLPLPPFVQIKEDPTATTVTYNRAIPTTYDTPALDPVLMSDGRAPSLEAQAADALKTHVQVTMQPTQAQLAQIAAYEKTLFSKPELEAYAKGGPAPTLPEGTTDSEKRGRAFFLPSGVCGACHSGPYLNTAVDSPFGPAGMRFANVGVSELNEGNQPVYTYVVTQPDGSTFEAPYTDLGRFLITFNPDDVGSFKIPTLWNVKNTAPYFHDNSAKTLDDVVHHYDAFFRFHGAPGLSDQDMADMVAYMKLL